MVFFLYNQVELWSHLKQLSLRTKNHVVSFSNKGLCKLPSNSHLFVYLFRFNKSLVLSRLTLLYLITFFIKLNHISHDYNIKKFHFSLPYNVAHNTCVIHGYRFNTFFYLRYVFLALFIYKILKFTLFGENLCWSHY